MEQQSDLSGGNWVVSATYLRGVGLVRRNNEFHHFDVLGKAGVITDASGAVLSSNVYDAFGVARYVSGNAQTQWRWLQAEEEGLVRLLPRDYMPQWGVALQKGGAPQRNCAVELQICLQKASGARSTCLAIVAIEFAACSTLCGVRCAGIPFCVGACVALCMGAAIIAALDCQRQYERALAACQAAYNKCVAAGGSR